jgi:hypothetical protein
MSAIHNQIQTYAGVTPGQPIVTTPTSGPGGRGTPVITSAQSQSTPGADVNAVPGVKAPASPGVAAAPEDQSNGATSASGINQTLNDATSPSNPIIPQPNILDQFASYTYSLSWYLVSPLQYKNLVNQSGKLNTNLWNLLAQSGGASAQSTSTNPTATPTPTYNRATAQAAGRITSTSSTTGRNKYFSLDYYLDDLEIVSTLQNRATSTTEISFKVVEPNGITLLSNLNSAIRGLTSKPEATWQNVHYVMVIRFYGYDDQGNLITNVGTQNGLIGATQDNTTAVVVKFVPFIITELKFSQANKTVEYHIKGGPANFVKPVGSGLGSIPYNLELTGDTVDKVLNGQVTTTVASATDGIITTPNPPNQSGTLNTSVVTSELSAYALQVTPLSSLGYNLNNLTR